MKLRGDLSNGLDLAKCYVGHEPEQHLRDFDHRLDSLDNANAGGIITFNKPHNSKST